MSGQLCKRDGRSGSGASSSTPYIYFSRLRVLENTVSNKEPTSNLYDHGQDTVILEEEAATDDLNRPEQSTENPNALKHFVSIQQKVKTIVAFSKRSCQATERLLTYQQNNGAGHVKKLVQEVPTRWNSTLCMLERIVEIKDAVKTSLDFEQLTDDEWNICSELCSALTPFVQVSTRLSAESCPTGSQVIVLTMGLLSVCTQLLQRPFNSVTRNVEELTKGLKDRFHNVEMSKSIGVATLLDPRFKTLVFESRVAAENAKKQLIEPVAQKMGDRRLTNTGQSHETVSTSTPTDPSSLWRAYDAIVKSTQSQGTPQSAAIVEVQWYLGSPVVSRSEEPLAWWREKYIFPNISKVVKEKFNIVAPSVQSDF
ncbi:zinc finger BED domain-containing protein 4-like [Schistocerca piceifrons]|uniref:zinc finger BED domain-containing protein 4-like n=1 Tax=Schistocerca piceifrons TaxID=274613 RepID=UPI001F5F295B|nr:zinc finger BED domain-containing protein 4-like [Schistocerca piceifrons]